MNLRTVPPAISAIPDPQEVQRQLAQAYRDADLLRSLLRLARRKQQAAEREHVPSEQGGDEHAV
jgi:hypothetical protein